MTDRPDYDLVARIGDVQFTPVRLVEGYDMGQVDYQLDLLHAAARKGDPLGPILDAIQLREVRLREGYDIAEVDSFLDSLRVTSDGAGVGVGSAAVPDTVSSEEEDLPSAAAPVVPAVPPAATSFPVPPIVVERRGLLARLFGRR